MSESVSHPISIDKDKKSKTTMHQKSKSKACSTFDVIENLLDILKVKRRRGAHMLTNNINC